MEISCIMWADDILILSETQEGLQQKLDLLHEYSKANKLTVNTKKTKCMIFNKTGRLLKKENFYYKGPVTIRKFVQITAFGRLGVGGFRPVAVIIPISVPAIELSYFKF